MWFKRTIFYGEFGLFIRELEICILFAIYELLGSRLTPIQFYILWEPELFLNILTESGVLGIWLIFVVCIFFLIYYVPLTGVVYLENFDINADVPLLLRTYTVLW